jgi:hypothetical protein
MSRQGAPLAAARFGREMFPAGAASRSGAGRVRQCGPNTAPSRSSGRADRSIVSSVHSGNAARRASIVRQTAQWPSRWRRLHRRSPRFTGVWKGKRHAGPAHRPYARPDGSDPQMQPHLGDVERFCAGSAVGPLWKVVEDRRCAGGCVTHTVRKCHGTAPHAASFTHVEQFQAARKSAAVDCAP